MGLKRREPKIILKRDAFINFDHVRRPLLALYHVPCPCPHPVLFVLSVFFRSVFFRSCALSPLVPGRMCEPCTPETLIEAVRGLRVADPDLGFKPLLAKPRGQQPDLGAGSKEVRKALMALKAESEAMVAAARPAANAAGAPSPVVVSLACVGCARPPSARWTTGGRSMMCARSAASESS